MDNFTIKYHGGSKYTVTTPTGNVFATIKTHMKWIFDMEFISDNERDNKGILSFFGIEQGELILQAMGDYDSYLDNISSPEVKHSIDKIPAIKEIVFDQEGLLNIPDLKTAYNVLALLLGALVNTNGEYCLNVSSFFGKATDRIMQYIETILENKDVYFLEVKNKHNDTIVFFKGK